MQPAPDFSFHVCCLNANVVLYLGIPNLEDANDAGMARSIDCTLILTERDSAKTLGVSDLGVIGRDRYGHFPLRSPEFAEGTFVPFDLESKMSLPILLSHHIFSARLKVISKCAERALEIHTRSYPLPVGNRTTLERNHTEK